jgi:hypothetical protein
MKISTLGWTLAFATLALPAAVSAQTSSQASTQDTTSSTIEGQPAPAPAEASSTAATETPPTQPATAPPPTALQRARISLPWHMRPMVAVTLLRIDGDIAFTNAGRSEATIASAGWAFIPNFGVFARIAMTNNQPNMGPSGTALSNPIVFGLWTPQIVPHIRAIVMGGLALPVGMGGGNHPDPGQRAAIASGVYTRLAMDNALFAVNYITPTVGLGLGYADHRVTVIAESTVLQLFRVRGEQLDLEPTRTNFTAGIHVGYTFIDYLTASVEMRYQRWLTTPVPVMLNPALRDEPNVEFGLRGNIPFSNKVLMRPGFGASVPLTGRLGPNKGWVLQFDVPVAFF